jgi:hypothetical protein
MGPTVVGIGTTPSNHGTLAGPDPFK